MPNAEGVGASGMQKTGTVLLENSIVIFQRAIHIYGIHSLTASPRSHRAHTYFDTVSGSLTVL